MLLQIILPKGNQEVQFEGINELKELSQKHWHDAPQYTLYSFSFTAKILYHGTLVCCLVAIDKSLFFDVMLMPVLNTA